MHNHRCNQFLHNKYKFKMTTNWNILAQQIQIQDNLQFKQSLHNKYKYTMTTTCSKQLTNQTIVQGAFYVKCSVRLDGGNTKLRYWHQIQFGNKSLKPPLKVKAVWMIGRGIWPNQRSRQGEVQSPMWFLLVHSLKSTLKIKIIRVSVTSR